MSRIRTFFLILSASWTIPWAWELCRVAQNRHDDAVQDAFQRHRNVMLLQRNPLLDADVRVLLFEFPAKPVDGRQQPHVVQDGRPQVGCNRPDLLDGILQNRDHRIHRTGRCVIRLAVVPAAFGFQLEGRQGLRHALMQLEGDFLLVRFLGLQHLGGQNARVSFRSRMVRCCSSMMLLARCTIATSTAYNAGRIRMAPATMMNSVRSA